MMRKMFLMSGIRGLDHNYFKYLCTNVVPQLALLLAILIIF